MIREKLRQDSIRNCLSSWYGGVHTWTCVDIGQYYPGGIITGTPIRVVILECASGERIRFNYMSDDIVKGTEVKLHPLTDDELKSSHWSSITDRYLRPVPLKAKTS